MSGFNELEKRLFPPGVRLSVCVCVCAQSWPSQLSLPNPSRLISVPVCSVCVPDFFFNNFFPTFKKKKKRKFIYNQKRLGEKRSNIKTLCLSHYIFHVCVCVCVCVGNHSRRERRRRAELVGGSLYLNDVALPALDWK